MDQHLWTIKCKIVPLLCSPQELSGLNLMHPMMFKLTTTALMGNIGLYLELLLGHGTSKNFNG